ncbi:unnamed protein product [Boreogadus saida]
MSSIPSTAQFCVFQHTKRGAHPAQCERDVFVSLNGHVTPYTTLQSDICSSRPISHSGPVRTAALSTYGTESAQSTQDEGRALPVWIRSGGSSSSFRTLTLVGGVAAIGTTTTAATPPTRVRSLKEEEPPLGSTMEEHGPSSWCFEPAFQFRGPPFCVLEDTELRCGWGIEDMQVM